MARLSPGLQIAFHLTNYEAVKSGQADIEPEHFLLGVASLDKVFNDEVRRQFEIGDAMLAQIEAEWRPVKEALVSGGADVNSLRRLTRSYLQTRQQLGLAVMKMPEITDNSRQVLARAAWLADQSPAGLMRVPDLLAALLAMLQQCHSPLLQQLKIAPEAWVAALGTNRKELLYGGAPPRESFS